MRIFARGSPSPRPPARPRPGCRSRSLGRPRPSDPSTAPGWTWLPFQVYVTSVYKDTVGQAIDGGGDMAAAMLDWQDRIAEYAQNQGFTVTD